MKIVIKKGGQLVNELFLGDQPCYIGRHSDCEVCLPDKTVSRKHAVIFPRESGQWFVEDLNSANKTYISGRQVQQADIKSGDTLLIGSFTIEVDLDAPTQNVIEAEETLQVEASLTTPRSETVVRRPDEVHAPAMRLAAKRLTDFSEAAEAICKTETLDNLLTALLSITMKQFEAFHTWAALRHQSAGPMTCHAGRKRDSTSVSFDQLVLKDKITQAIEKKQSIVFPSVSAEMEQTEKIRSAMIAPIIRRGGCLGILYVDNAMMHEHYTLGDLDYLILLAMHTAAVLKYYL